MFNLNVIEKKELYYDENHYPVEDLELWFRLLSKYKSENLSERLLQYRIVSSSISSLNSELQKDMKINLKNKYFSNLPKVKCFSNLISNYKLVSNIKLTSCFFDLLFSSELKFFSHLEISKLYIRVLLSKIKGVGR